MKKPSTHYFFKSLLFSLIIAIFLFFSFRIGLFWGIENFLEDILFENKPVDERLIIVGIDNESIEKFGQWPWSRKTFSQFFEALNLSEPLAVGFDVLLSEKSRMGDADDAALQNALKNIKYPLVMAAEATDFELTDNTSKKFIFPLSEFYENENVSLGHVNLVSDKDGVVRRVPIEIMGPDDLVYRGISAGVAMSSRLVSEKQLSDRKKIERIVYSGGSGRVRMVPFWRVLSQDFDRDILKGKIIFVGATAADLHDTKQTPMDRGTEMSGVEIQAQIANMLLKDFRLDDLSQVAVFFWLFFAAFIPFLLFYFLSNVPLSIFFLLVAGVAHTSGIIILFSGGKVVNLVHINLAWIIGGLFAFLYKYFSLDKEKRLIRDTFSKYLSKDVLEDLLRDPSRVKLGGEEREVTVFFSDVRGFTTLSEGMSPQELTHFLNKYLTRMTDIILKKRGVVDKYIGDAIMAFWGAPMVNDNHALDAVLAAVEMIESLSELNKENIRQGEPVINIGIGLNSGRVTVGNMGSSSRFDYTIMGDAVNLASRLESQTKNYGVSIIISKATKDKISQDEAMRHRLIFREIDKIFVKGKNESVVLFEVVTDKSKEDFLKIRDLFEEMRASYYAGKWSDAVSLAREIEKKTNDGPAKVIKERCEFFIDTPPENWKGAYEMKNK
jgi:adenylate cyclase